MIYAIGIVLAIISGFFIWGKIQSARADRADTKAYAAMETAKSAQAEISQANKTAVDVEVVKKFLTSAQKAGQVKIDAGDRSFLDKDSF